jgi:membrane-associated phospholipid phosphatase
MSRAGTPRLVGRLGALDQRLLDRLGGVESELLDHVLPGLGRAADYGRLWIAVAGILVLTGRPDARRAAARGLASLAVASTTANVVAKGRFGRIRPVTDLVPPVRWLRRAPMTTSFPSGHSASAAAFATGAALEMPAAAVPLGGLAAAVAASRVVTGAHFPSDVAAGVLVGVGAAAFTLRVRRRGPSRTTTDRAPRRRR